MKQKIILDTDIGDDIDDALALLLLLKFDCADLIGVTTVFRNTCLRARLAKHILHLAGRKDIPVYAGYGNPLAGEADQQAGFVQYTPELDDAELCPDNLDPRNAEEAVSFLVRSAKKYGSDLTILAIGPYTNLARACSADPEAFTSCRIVLMGGCFYEQFIEYNVQMDPEACDVLLKSKLPLRFIGADVTWKAQLNDAQTRAVLSIESPDLRGYCAGLVRLWKRNCWFNPVLHDPLAVYYVLDESICEMEEVWTEVELNGAHTRGFTVNMDRVYKYLENKTPGKRRVLCARTVNAERFIRIFLEKTFELREVSGLQY